MRISGGNVAITASDTGKGHRDRRSITKFNYQGQNKIQRGTKGASLGYLFTCFESSDELLFSSP